MTVKPRHLLSLLQADLRTIEVIFPADSAPDEAHPARDRSTGRPLAGNAKRYTYKHEGDVAVGDTVVVESPQSGLCCVRVVEVHDTPKIDLDASFTYKWTVQRVDTAAYLARLDREERFTAQVEAAQRVHQRQQLLAQYADAFPVGSPARAEFDRAVAEFNPRLADEMKVLASADDK